MKKSRLSQIYGCTRAAWHLGWSKSLQYFFSPSGSHVKITIDGVQIFVRKGTPDLEVALSCLTGEFDILSMLMPEDFDGMIIDAGGYIGTATLAMKKIWPSAEILIVEPSSQNIEILRKNISSLTNVKVVHGALVGEQRKEVPLLNRGTGEWGFTVVTKPNDAKVIEQIANVKAYTISDLVTDFSKLGLLKLDIEGGELDLLRYDNENLRLIPIVFAELHDHISPGCVEQFLDYSKPRILIKDKGEKYLSIRR